MVGLPDTFDSSECRLDEEEVSGQSVVLSNGRYELPPARIASWRLRPNGKLF